MERERKGGDGITGKSGDTHTLPLIERAGRPKLCGCGFGERVRIPSDRLNFECLKVIIWIRIYQKMTSNVVFLIQLL
jgi:hypothetical protein